MSNETPRRGGGRRIWALWCLLSLGGCSFLADEFTWLDRAAPSTKVAPDAPTTGLVERP